MTQFTHIFPQYALCSPTHGHTPQGDDAPLLRLSALSFEPFTTRAPSALARMNFDSILTETGAHKRLPAPKRHAEPKPLARTCEHALRGMVWETGETWLWCRDER